KYDATSQASGWMEQQLDELKAKVEKSQQALVDYERQNAIVNISDKQSVVEQRLADLSRDLTNAQSDRVQKESLYELVKSNESQVAFVAQNDLLQREFDTNQQLYDSLLQRLKDATVSAGLRATNIHVVDPARPPKVPVRPQRLLNIATSLVVGLMLGVTLAFVKEALDSSIKSI